MAGRVRKYRNVATISLFALATGFLAAPGLAQTNTAPTIQSVRIASTDVDFDPVFFRRGKGPAVDVSRYEKGNPVSAGRYLVDLRLNGTFVARTEIAFNASASDLTAQPCLDETMLDKLGVDLARITPATLARLRAAPGGCLPLSDVVPVAVSSFSLGDQILELSIPQAALRNNPRGYVDPRFWDRGVTAGLLGYNFNLFHTSGRASSTQGYLGLDAGLNVGAWRFRHDGALTFGSAQRARYDSNRTYVQRDITSLKSQLLIGDAFTDGQIFDSIGYRGVSLATDDRMLSESLRGYAPVVRGTARTNANVVIRQNGSLIYQSTVAPGPFEIRDLYATGYGGDLVVTVNEADGESETFTIPFAAIPQLLRRGTTRFSLTAGEVRDNGSDAHPLMIQATAQRGISNLLTAYAGGVLAGRYRAALAGVALNTRMGAFGVDLTVADAGLPGISSKGASLRLSYAHLISATGTNFTVAAYRYSSEGFWSLQSALQAHSFARADAGLHDIDRPSNSFQLTVTQPLGARWGSFYLTGSTQQYWNRSGNTTYYQAGYTNRYRMIGYALSASRQIDTVTKRPDSRLMLSLNFSLGRGAHTINVSSMMTASDNNRFQSQTTVSGTAGNEGDINWGATYAHQGDDNSASGTLQYRSRIANLSGGVGAGNGYRQGSFGASGTVLVHSGGITLGLPVGESIGLLYAPGASGARVSSSPGARVDGNGYAIVPYLTPYIRNTVNIDPKGLGLNVELNETSQSITPRAGAVVRLKYNSVTGRAAIITVRMANGLAIPFGASVLSPSGETIGQAGQAGRMFVRGVADSGSLIVRWGDGTDEQCRLDYRLAPRIASAVTAYDHADATCTAIPANNITTPSLSNASGAQ